MVRGGSRNKNQKELLSLKYRTNDPEKKSYSQGYFSRRYSGKTFNILSRNGKNTTQIVEKKRKRRKR